MTLWQGRFTARMDPVAWVLNASLDIDRRLAAQDVRGSIAWTKALEKAGLLSAHESVQLCDGLQKVGGELAGGTFAFHDDDEDIHTAVERRLGELVGPVAGKLHTGRSRNDQVATDFRLWLLDHLPALDEAIAGLQTVLIGRAEADSSVIMPGYTHLQRAQPVLLSHWWLAHFWPLHRDRQRLAGVHERTAVLPLGSGALAGVPFAIDRQALAADLGFVQPSPNSIDAVADRDFAVEFLFCAALSGVHLSRMAEAIILFSSAEFGFFELADEFATGSSLMPQKKNPDVFELARGKTGTLIGLLVGLMATLKALPSAYDKDLQEDKAPVFAAYDTMIALLRVLASALRTLTIRPDRLREKLGAELMVTDLADYLVGKGIPFREAHALAGKAVQLAASQGKAIDTLRIEEFRTVHPSFADDVTQVFDPMFSIQRRRAEGGTAPEAVAVQLKRAKELAG